MEVLGLFQKSLVASFSSPEPDFIAGKVVAIILLMLIVVGICIYILIEVGANSSKDPRVAPPNVALTKTSQETSLSAAAARGEGFVDLSSQGSLYNSLLSTIDPSEQYLVNLCPLTASIGGYIGPTISGVFDPDYYVQQALRAGIRAFVLPISVYYDDNKKPPEWPYSGKPAVVCRNAAGKILSLNGMSIRKFCKSLVTYMSINSAQANEPIILYLDATPGHIPDILKAEKEYVQFTSDIAEELKPLDPYRLLTISSYGSATGGVNQMNILTQIPLTEFQNKILIFTNFNITAGTKDAYSSIRPLLYEYVNFVYSPVTATTIGVAKTNNCDSVHLMDVSGSLVNWTDQAVTSWMFVGQDDFTQLHDTGAIEAATTTGIQSIPVPFFFVDPSKTKAIWKQWSGYAWKMKAPAARYTKPAPITPMTPTTALNARVSDSLQPGQTLIKV